MTWPSLPERWAMDQQEWQVAAGQANAAAAETEAVREATEEWGATVLRLAHCGRTMRMDTWAHSITSLTDTPDWVDIPVDVDLAGAVSLTATLHGRLPRSPMHEQHSIWDLHRELSLTFALQDSLDGESWHKFAQGNLTHTAPSQAVRVTSALGSVCRVRLYCYPVVASIRRSDGSTTRERDPSGNPDGLTIEQLDIRVAIRSI